MTVEDIRGKMDRFPVGLRVLAVDDDPTCLKVLETLLRRCQYTVTVTNQAITALELLRENKDKFDLVISDVHMPDMDGFKLLELVGLEMDLPVIMLSGNGETQTVMKGITHGACDYLLKPVRLEELKNIWQHVIRRKRYEKRCHSQKKCLNNAEGGEDDQKTQDADTEGVNGATDNSEKLCKKRKDQSEEYEDDSEDQENEDGSTQKKPRVVWTVELHQKFVAAVNQLGVDKAVPKKILDLMNVENITRENVASHLQKYRLYLKRISTVASQQGSLAAALAGRNSYIHMASFNGYRNYNALGGSRQLPNITAYQPNRYLGRINTSASLGMNGLLPSQTVQLGGHKSSSYSFGGLEKPQDINALGNLQVASIQGVPMPMKLELDGLEQPKIVHEARNQSMAGYSGSRLTAGVPVNSFPTFGNSTVLRPKKEYSQAGASGYCSSIGIPSTSSNPFEINFQESSQTTHLVRCNGINSLPVLAAPFTHSGFSTGTNMQTVSSVSLPKESNVLGESSNGMPGKSQHDSDRNSNVQSLLGGSMMALPSGVGEESEISRLLANSRQKWDDNFASNALSTTCSNSSFPNFKLTDTIAQQQLPDYSVCNAALAAPDLVSNPLVSNSSTDSQQSYKDEYALETAWWQDGLGNGGSLDDLLNSVVKPV